MFGNLLRDVVDMMALRKHNAIMIRTQIQFEQETYEELHAMAKEVKSSVSELVRHSVKKYLKKVATDHAWQKALAATGRFKSGHKDISTKHDQYLDNEW